MSYLTVKYCIYPNNKQEVILNSWNDAMRFLWNCALEHRFNILESYKKNRAYFLPKTEQKIYFITAYDQAKGLTEIRNNPDFKFIKALPRTVSVSMLEDLERVWNTWRKGDCGEPKFKKKNKNFFSFECKDTKSFNIIDKYLNFPKLKRIRLVKHRDIKGIPVSCIISKDVDQWFVSITYNIENTIETLPLTGKSVGIDRGVVNITTDSNGKITENPRLFEKQVDKITHLQKSISRKKKGSNNRKKEVIKLQKVYRKVRRQKEHFIHELVNYYIKNHDVIILEKLNIKGMSKAPKTIKKRKSKLNSSILNSCWGLFDTVLNYKAKLFGRIVDYVSAHYT
jgi:putative transposase